MSDNNVLGPQSENKETAIEGDQQSLTRGTSPSSSMECIMDMSERQERVLRWTTSLRSRYDVAPSYMDTSRNQILEQGSDCRGFNTASNMHRPVVTANTTKLKRQGSKATSTSDDVEYSDEESYLETASFGLGMSVYPDFLDDLFFITN